MLGGDGAATCFLLSTECQNFCVYMISSLSRYFAASLGVQYFNYQIRNLRSQNYRHQSSMISVCFEETAVRANRQSVDNLRYFLLEDELPPQTLKATLYCILRFDSSVEYHDIPGACMLLNCDQDWESLQIYGIKAPLPDLDKDLSWSTMLTL